MAILPAAGSGKDGAAMKLWTGRFSKEADQKTNDFNSSISFDSRMYQQDLQGSMAHATMLCACGIISEKDRDEILGGLQGILADIQSGKLAIDPDAEDIHTFVEAELTARIGEAGKRLHTARSRNDQVALDMRLYVKSEIREIITMICTFMKALAKKSRENLDAVMPGYTHLQRAQPTTFAHYMMAYANMLKRDITRLQDCYERMDEMPLGSGALASTTYPIDREFVRQQLGFKRLTDNSLDGVSDRDYCVELLSALSILMMHLSRLSEELILWSTGEFGFIELDDGYSTGSSIMPQKKNPDICELVRGKTGRVYGHLVALLTVMKGLPLAYDKDMQEDKEGVFDAIDTLRFALDIYAGMLSTMTVNGARTRAVLENDFSNATDMADYLAKKGLPFRRAHTVVGNAVAYCIENRKVLLALTMEEFKKMSPLFETDIYEVLQIENCVKNRDSYGGTGPEQVKRQQREAKKIVSRQKKLAAEWKEVNAFIE